MGVRITNGTEAVLYCSTTGTAFGPVFEDWDQAESFFQWYVRRNPAVDLRLRDDSEVEKLHYEWRAWREEHKAFEEDCRRCGETFEKDEPEMEGTCEKCQRADWQEEA